VGSSTGSSAPLHRRFNEAESLEHIRSRYSECRRLHGAQVEILQADTAFRARCQEYYGQGYPDWVIVSAIGNCVLNWRSEELGLHIPEEDTPENLKRVVLSLEQSPGVYPARRFLARDLDLHVRVHALTALPSYGFRLRRRDVKPEVVERLLRERLRHYDLDLPHEPMFGEPPGAWPEL
jgi:hypothetical protein